MVGWLRWLSPRKKKNFSGTVPAYGPMWQAQQSRQAQAEAQEQARRARFQANIQAIDEQLRRVRNDADRRAGSNRIEANRRARLNSNEANRRARLNSNARMAAELQAAENAHSAMQLSLAHANSLPRSNTLPSATSLAPPRSVRATWTEPPPRSTSLSSDPETQLWDDYVRHTHQRYERNTSKQINLEKRVLGKNSLANNVSVKDPFTLETVNPDEAVYLATNLPPGSRKVQQLYDWEGIQGLLQQRQAVSPLTRKIFTEDDVKRVEASAVRNVIARMR